jgi:hypothetical protein
MLSKRWRTVVTGDELFQDRLLIDFRQFCTGSDGRLQQHWQRARVISDAFNKFNQLLEDRRTLTQAVTDRRLQHTGFVCYVSINWQTVCSCASRS